MSELDIPESEREQIDHPAWSERGRVHDWRNYIPLRVRENWHRLSLETRMVAYAMATDRADAEEWD